MKELGYEPNFQASNLASRNTRTIGIILPVSAREVYENSFYLEAIRGISQVCNQQHYISTIVTGQDEDEVLGGCPVHVPHRAGRRLYPALFQAE